MPSACPHGLLLLLLLAFFPSRRLQNDAEQTGKHEHLLLQGRECSRSWAIEYSVSTGYLRVPWVRQEDPPGLRVT